MKFTEHLQGMNEAEERIAQAAGLDAYQEVVDPYLVASEPIEQIRCSLDRAYRGVAALLDHWQDGRVAERSYGGSALSTLLAFRLQVDVALAVVLSLRAQQRASEEEQKQKEEQKQTEEDPRTVDIRVVQAADRSRPHLSPGDEVLDTLTGARGVVVESYVNHGEVLYGVDLGDDHRIACRTRVQVAYTGVSAAPAEEEAAPPISPDRTVQFGSSLP